MSATAAELSPEYRFTPAPALPRTCTSILNRICDRCWETYLNIRTAGDAPSRHVDAHRYGYLAYHTYGSILDSLALGPADVVADLGCGKGRVSCLAAHYRIKASIGIEIDSTLFQLARANGARMKRRRSALEFVCQSAVDFDYDEVTAVVMFHPFGHDTMRAVLTRWQESLIRRPRPFRVAYANPLHSPLIAANPTLQLYACWKPGAWSRVKFPVHFYRTAQTVN